MAGASSLLVATVLGLVFPVLGTWTDDWSSIRAAASQVDSVQAEFVQTKQLKVLKRPIVSKGRFYYQRPGKIRWEYASPVKCVVILDGSEVRRYVWRDGRYVEDASAKAKPLQRVLRQMGFWLSGDFSKSRVFTPELVQGDPVRVRLTPSDATVKKYVTGIDVLLSGTPGVVDAIEISEGPDASTRIAFSDAKLNQPIPGWLFEKAR
jgi:outer membrane lipoprotein carrier protein